MSLVFLQVWIRQMPKHTQLQRLQGHWLSLALCKLPSFLSAVCLFLAWCIKCTYRNAEGCRCAEENYSEGMLSWQISWQSQVGSSSTLPAQGPPGLSAYPSVSMQPQGGQASPELCQHIADLPCPPPVPVLLSESSAAVLFHQASWLTDIVDLGISSGLN